MQEGEVIPPYVEIDDGILRTKDAAEEQFDMQMEHAEAQFEMQQNFTPKEENQGGVSSGAAAGGSGKGSNTLPTPLRPGKHAD